jgi:hypothetical protein
MTRHVFEGIAVVSRGGRGKLPPAPGAVARFPNSHGKPVKPVTLRRLSKLKIPVRYTPSRKLAILDRVGIAAGKLVGEPQLSAREPCTGGVGDLYFYGALEYLSKDNRVIMLMSGATPGGFIVVRAAPAAPGSRYLLDVRLSALAQPFVRSYDGTVVRADAQGHALFVATAGADRTAVLSLTVDGTGLYNFHDVTISRIS